MSVGKNILGSLLAAFLCLHSHPCIAQMKGAPVAGAGRPAGRQPVVLQVPDNISRNFTQSLALDNFSSLTLTAPPKIEPNQPGIRADRALIGLSAIADARADSGRRAAPRAVQEPFVPGAAAAADGVSSAGRMSVERLRAPEPIDWDASARPRAGSTLRIDPDPSVAVAETYIESLRIGLMELGRSDLAARLDRAGPARIPSPDGRTQAALFDAVQRAALRKIARNADDETAIFKAAASVRGYLGVKDIPLVRLVAAPVSESLPEPGQPSRRDTIFPDAPAPQTAWADADRYTALRLGAAAPYVDALGDGDRVLISNVPLARSLAELAPVLDVQLLSLPLASYEKKLYWIRHVDGTRTLLLAEMPGRIYSEHYELMIRRRLGVGARARRVRISRLEKPAAYERVYDSLKNLVLDHQRDFQHVEALVIGYENAFRSEWGGRRVRSLGDGKASWGADLYRLADGKIVAVLTGDQATHGEILGQQVSRALELLPRVQAVFFAGSGGSLKSESPYSMVFPRAVSAGGVLEVPNVLSSGAEKWLHRSVRSPLAEGPNMLSRLFDKGVRTVDMEVSGLAAAAARRNISLGVGILITDYPIPRGSFSGVNLSRQDFGAKRTGRSRYVQAVERYIASGRPAFAHPIETRADRSIDELSASNIARFARQIGRLTRQEREIVSILRRLDFSPLVRMSPSRLHWMIEEGALLSSKQVADRGFRTEPTTPKIEDRMFGAHDYIFATLEAGPGLGSYGSVSVKLREQAVERRSWATQFSGWQRFASVQKRFPQLGGRALLQRARQEYADQVIAPRHYRKALEYQVIEQIRRLPEDERARFYAAGTPGELRELLIEKHIGRLELKLKSYVDLDEVEEIRVAGDVRPELVAKMKALGLRVVEAPVIAVGMGSR